MKKEIKILLKAIIFHNNKILIMKRSNKESLSGYWDFPGGNLDFLESKEKSIQREIYEETGLMVKDIPQFFDEELIYKRNKKHYLLFLFKANVNHNKIRLSSEHDDFKWIKKSDLSKIKLNPILKF